MAHLQISAILPANRSQVFDLLTSAEKVPDLLAPRLDVQLVRAAETLKRGVEYEFLMTRYGLSQTVRLRIEDFLKGSRLTYRQTEGLFQEWVHTMKFEDHGENQTLVTDFVDYKVPFGLIGYLADDLFLRRDLKSILEKRLAIAKSMLQVPQQEATV